MADANIVGNVTQAGSWSNVVNDKDIATAEARTEYDSRFSDIPSNTPEASAAWDAYRHAYVSGRLVQMGYDVGFVHFLGTVREIPQIITSPEDANMDRYNNELGRGVGESTPSQLVLAQAIEDIIRDGTAITDKVNDPRNYEGGEPTLSQNDFDELANAPASIASDPEEQFTPNEQPVPAFFANLPLFSIDGFDYTPAILFGGFDPLVIDMDNSGTIDLTSVANGVHFDFWGDGMAEKTGWVDAADGMLVHDLDFDGLIEGVAEMFGSPFPLGFLTDTDWANVANENGFAKLALLDSNADGKIDSADIAWGELQVWQDINQDGVSQVGELVTLDVAGIESIDVSGYVMDSFVGMAAGGFTRIIEGNTVTHSGTVTMTDSTTREVADVWFDHDLANSTYAGDYTLDVRTLFLPTLRGYGNLPDLHIAMSLDNGVGGLLDEVSNFMTARNGAALFTDFDGVQTEVRSILMNWAGVDENAAASYKAHGVFEEMAEFSFLRELTGVTGEFLGTWFDESGFLPWADQAIPAIHDSWNNVLDAMTARFVFQSGGADLFDSGAAYNAAADVFEGTLRLSQTAIDDLESDATTHADKDGFWHNVAEFIDNTMGLDQLNTAELAWLDSAVTTSTSSAFDWGAVVAGLSDNDITASAADQTLTGTQWDDNITALSGNNTLIGGAGDDFLFGSTGDDIHQGGAGNDRYSDGFGNDTFIYDSGHDVISSGGSAGGMLSETDVIQMAAGITASDVSLHLARVDTSFTEHLFLKIEGKGTITIQNAGIYGTTLADTIDEIHYADGTVQNFAGMDITVYGTDETETIAGAYGFTGSNHLSGFDGDDYIWFGNGSGDFVVDGGAGNDDIQGGGGDDTYIVSAGQDTVYDGAGNDAIQIVSGYTLSDVSFVRLAAGGTMGGSWDEAEIIVDGLGSIIIQNQFMNNGAGGEHIETLKLADGSTIDLSTQIYEVRGTAGDDVISDNWSWPQKDDAYLFGQGNDIVYDSYGGTDTIRFATGITLADLTIQRFDDTTSGGPSDTHLRIEDQNGIVTLNKNKTSQDLQRLFLWTCPLDVFSWHRMIAQ